MTRTENELGARQQHQHQQHTVAAHRERSRRQIPPTPARSSPARHVILSMAEPETPSVKDLEEQLTELQAGVDKALTHVATFRKLMKQGEIEQKQAASSTAVFRKKLKGVQATLRGMQAGFVPDDALYRLEDLIDSCHGKLQDVNKVKPRTGRLFLRLWMGRVNVMQFREQELHTHRREYDKFRNRTSLIFLLFPSFSLYFREHVNPSWSQTAFQLWLMYYYITMSLRLNILQVNGSRIKNWWIWHHYISAALATSMLTWQGDDYQQYELRFQYFMIFQGVVQLAQNWYQKRRHYSLRALGKLNPGDVASSETPQRSDPQLMVLLPFLLLTQGLELFFGFLLLQAAFQQAKPGGSVGSWLTHESFSGSCFVTLGLGNFVTLCQTLIEKRSRASKRRARASKKLT